MEVPFTSVTVNVPTSGSLSTPLPLSAKRLFASIALLSVRVKSSFCATGASLTEVTVMMVAASLTRVNHAIVILGGDGEGGGHRGAGSDLVFDRGENDALNRRLSCSGRGVGEGEEAAALIP